MSRGFFRLNLWRSNVYHPQVIGKWSWHQKTIYPSHTYPIGWNKKKWHWLSTRTLLVVYEAPISGRNRCISGNMVKMLEGTARTWKYAIPEGKAGLPTSDFDRCPTNLQKRPTSLGFFGKRDAKTCNSLKRTCTECCTYFHIQSLWYVYIYIYILCQ